MDSDKHLLPVKKSRMKTLNEETKHEFQPPVNISEGEERARSSAEVEIQLSSKKKYSSIGEVIKLLNIQAHQLRYLENTLPELAIYKIRNRRYYTNHDIEYLKNHLAKSKSNKDQPLSAMSTINRVQKIEQLINKFLTLSDSINKLIINKDKENRIPDPLDMKQMSFKGY